MVLMISKLINGLLVLIGLRSINERLNHLSSQKRKDLVSLIDSLLIHSFTVIDDLLGDASNFDDYEEEPRKREREEIYSIKIDLCCLF